MTASEGWGEVDLRVDRHRLRLRWGAPLSEGLAGIAVSAIAEGYRSGNPGSRLATLATYLGHVDPKHTYWYLSAAPELLGLAGDMLERHLAGEA